MNLRGVSSVFFVCLAYSSLEPCASKVGEISQKPELAASSSIPTTSYQFANLSSEQALQSWTVFETPILQQRTKRHAFDWRYNPSEQSFITSHFATRSNYLSAEDNGKRIKDTHQPSATEAPLRTSSEESDLKTTTPEAIRRPDTFSSSVKPELRQKALARPPYKRPSRLRRPPSENYHSLASRNPHASQAVLDLPYDYRRTQLRAQTRYSHFYSKGLGDEYHWYQGCTDECYESLLPLVALSGLGFLMIYLVTAAQLPGKRRKRNASQYIGKAKIIFLRVYSNDFLQLLTPFSMHVRGFR